MQGESLSPAARRQVKPWSESEAGVVRRLRPVSKGPLATSTDELSSERRRGRRMQTHFRAQDVLEGLGEDWTW